MKVGQQRTTLLTKIEIHHTQKSLTLVSLASSLSHPLNIQSMWLRLQYFTGQLSSTTFGWFHSLTLHGYLPKGSSMSLYMRVPPPSIGITLPKSSNNFLIQNFFHFFISLEFSWKRLRQAAFNFHNGVLENVFAKSYERICSCRELQRQNHFRILGLGMRLFGHLSMEKSAPPAPLKQGKCAFRFHLHRLFMCTCMYVN